jgi:hypothetical protein
VTGRGVENTVLGAVEVSSFGYVVEFPAEFVGRVTLDLEVFAVEKVRVLREPIRGI